MDFISWAVIGFLFILTEIGIGSRHALAIGLAFLYPVIADLVRASMGVQVAVLLLGVLIHLWIVVRWRKRNPAEVVHVERDDVGQRVEVIEWLDDCTARVRYQDKMWEADKARAEMPDAEFGIILAVQYGRLIISTEAQTLAAGRT